MQTRKCLCETKGAREGSLTGKMNSEKSDHRGGGDQRQEEDGATVASHCLVWVLLFYDVCFQGAPVNSRKATQIKDGSHSFYPSFSPTATAISLAVFSRLLQTNQVSTLWAGLFPFLLYLCVCPWSLCHFRLWNCCVMFAGVKGHLGAAFPLLR